MRTIRTTPFLVLLATAAACGTPANSATVQSDAPPAVVEAAPVPVAEAVPGVAIDVRWDSGPLDRSYRRERSDLDASHARERAHPVASEPADRLSRRQAEETKALELRYTRGKKEHDERMPPK